METAADERRRLEQLDVYTNRYDEARKAGLRHEDAEHFAYSGIDVGALRKLVCAGATPDVIKLLLF